MSEVAHDEVRGRAIRVVLDHEGGHLTKWHCWENCLLKTNVAGVGIGCGDEQR